MTPLAFIAATLTGTLTIPRPTGTRKFQCADSLARPKVPTTKRKARVYKRPEGVKPHLAREQIAEIVARRAAGESRNEIAQRFGINPATVSRIFTVQTRK